MTPDQDPLTHLIAAALLPMMPFRFPQVNANAADEMARAVREALLAKGWLGWTDPEGDYSTREIHTDQLDPWARSPVLVIPLEAS